MRAAILVTLAFTLPRLILGWALPLVDDEAYYHMWSTLPGLGTYDHPPMVSFMIASGTALLGRTELAVRLFAILAVSAASLVVADTARRVAQSRDGDGPEAALRAALIFNVTWLLLIVFATPDAASVLFWAIALWAALRAMDRPSLAWWLIAGAAAGLGVFSKFTDLFLCLGVVLWLFGSGEGRRQARGPGPWVAALMALLVLAPLIWWNATHGWIGLERQFGRVTPDAFDWQQPLIYLAGAVLYLSPFALIWAWSGWREMGRGRALLAFTTLPMPIYLFVHSTQHDAPANWLLPLAAPLAILAAQAPVSRWHARFWPLMWGALGWIVLALLLKPGTPVIGDNPSPNQWRDWDRAAQIIANTAQDTAAQWIATDDYPTTADVHWWLPSIPVWQVTEPQRYMWRQPFPRALCDAPGLLLQLVPGPGDETLALFDTHGASQSFDRLGGTRVLQRYRLTPVQGLRSPACAGH